MHPGNQDRDARRREKSRPGGLSYQEGSVFASPSKGGNKYRNGFRKHPPLICTQKPLKIPAEQIADIPSDFRTRHTPTRFQQCLILLG